LTGPVRNPIGLRQRLDRLRGVPVDLDLSAYDAPLAAIGAAEEELRRLADGDLQARMWGLRDQALAGAPLESLQVPAFALVREASRRVLGLRPFDVQVVAALALLGRNVVEMQTGEGKTLAAVMPACVQALEAQGVHVLTFNDYLARRDAEWMGPVYRFLGLSVGWIQGGLEPEARRRAYAADVTYVTAKEAGFDHLRDLLALDAATLVHRGFHCALVDEADSLLVDEARTPLVIAGSAERRVSAATRLAAVVAGLTAGVHFTTDDYGRNVEPTEAGFQRVEEALGCGSLHAEENYGLLTELHCALHARVLLRRDADYIVRGGRIELVDELTGRVVADRHWPDGLQAALEAKEGLERRSDGHILGSITLQHLLGSYPRLSGMTGTARDAAHELHETYGLRVVVIPTHRPPVRRDQPDVVFTHREAKDAAVVAEVRAAHATGRPVLVGTLTVAESEALAERLRAHGVPCEVLNARNDALEARVVAGAGALGAVTISTNMAGRGTDIRLGGPDEAGRAAVVALGGLYVIGTQRQDSRRVDRQLRGRAGRQGDPGESRFFVSLDDDLLVRYGLRGLLPEPVAPLRQDAPLDHPVVRREIARAQRIIEGQDFEIRRTLARYAWPVEEHRRILHERRQDLLLGRRPPDVWREDPRYPSLAAAAGEDALRRTEVLVTLLRLDRGWRDHLAFVADLRDGIHLVRLGGGDPLSRFKVESTDAFHRMEDEVDQSVLEALDAVAAAGGSPDAAALDVKGPSATWTYLVSDDPFRDQLGSQLTGPGKTTLAIGAALFAGPLLILLGVVDRLRSRRRR
jgi:preprotein translocase subunit SecA